MLSDSGWKVVREGRCFVRTERVVIFDSETEQQKNEFVSYVKKTMYGQVSKVINIDSNTVKFIHEVDSGG